MKPSVIRWIPLLSLTWILTGTGCTSLNREQSRDLTRETAALEAVLHFGEDTEVTLRNVSGVITLVNGYVAQDTLRGKSQSIPLFWKRYGSSASGERKPWAMAIPMEEVSTVDGEKLHLRRDAEGGWVEVRRSFSWTRTAVFLGILGGLALSTALDPPLRL